MSGWQLSGGPVIALFFIGLGVAAVLFALAAWLFARAAFWWEHRR